MPEGQRSVVHGVSGSTTVNADMKSLGSAVPVKVTLTANYTLAHPPGIPSRPSFTGSAIAEYPHTILSGTVLTLHKYEADALVAAGGATYS